MHFYFLTFAHAIPCLEPDLSLTHSTPPDRVLPSAPTCSMKSFPTYQTSVASPMSFMAFSLPLRSGTYHIWPAIVIYLFRCKAYFPNERSKLPKALSGIS